MLNLRHYSAIDYICFGLDQALRAISDNTKTKEPFFVETDRLTPSQLPEDDQKLFSKILYTQYHYPNQTKKVKRKNQEHL